MVKIRSWCCLYIMTTVLSFRLYAAGNGSIRGSVYDNEFDSPLIQVQITITETMQQVQSNAQGGYLVPEVAPGVYTLVFSREGYVSQVKADVVVGEGVLTELNIRMEGDYTDMEEFIVQDIALDGASEAALLELRFDSPALLDSVGADMMSKAGVSDAASALRLVSGATVQDGKYAVIRGLPDRYVNSQLNGIRLPTADSDKRAVQLDQFPAAVIESMQVSKTFMPDQQGDASGGAVNVVLKGIPEEPILSFSVSSKWNTNEAGDKFLSYKGGGLNFWGRDNRDIPTSGNFANAAGVSETDSPTDYKWSVAGGGRKQLNDEVKLGGFGGFYYERDSSFYDDGRDDKYVQETIAGPLTPQYTQGSPSQGNFLTQLFDVTKASQEIKWGALGVLGLETEDHAFKFMNLYTHAAEDTTILAEDTRGKYLFFPDYQPYDPTSAGNQQSEAAPFLRTETLEYTERTTHTMQLSGKHKFSEAEFDLGENFTILPPELSWGVSLSKASMYQPDKRMFSSTWTGPVENAGYPEYGIPGWTSPAYHGQYKPAENFTLGNFQRVWKEVEEKSQQYYADIKIPFERWSDSKGFIKAGIFNDKVTRDYFQDSFSNLNDNGAFYQGNWEDRWSEVFPDEGHPNTPAEIDVDYRGRQNINAFYAMSDLPLNEKFNLVGGARFERTELSIVNYPDSEVNWIPWNSPSMVHLNPGDADVDFSQDDILPAIGINHKLNEHFTTRISFSQTVARQTFKELSPIQQQEYLGGDVFIGNKDLQMSALNNYDLRFDYTPYQDGLVSLSFFHKDVKDPIEYVQRNAGFTYTTATNYPEGKIDGIEIEFRQQLGHIWPVMKGLGFGTNATIMESEVTLPEYDAELFETTILNRAIRTRDMSNTPSYLYNVFATMDLPGDKTQLGVFYTVRGDTLIAGAGQLGSALVPDVYEKSYGTLNASVSHKFGEIWTLKFQAKNLLDPAIKTVYRSPTLGEDVVKTSHHKGIEFSLGLSAKF